MNKGWIYLYRQLLDCPLWNSNESYDGRSAWIDLLLLCNHADKTIVFDGSSMVVGRGQYVTSVRSLSQRWMWGKDKTLRYLRMLEKMGMIVKKSDRHKTIITIVKYDVYQTIPYSQRDTDETQTRHNQDTDKPQTINVKNEKNVYIGEVGDLYNQICISFPKLKSLSEARKKAIKARLNTYSIDDFRKMFEKAEASDFLKGKNNKDWTATFDWMIKDSNMAKILDGNYDNKAAKKNAFNNFDNAKYDKKLFEEAWD